VAREGPGRGREGGLDGGEMLDVTVNGTRVGRALNEALNQRNLLHFVYDDEGFRDAVRFMEAELDLIATGFAEAAIAVNNAVHFVNPDARVNPGHSTNMKVFKDK